MFRMIKDYLSSFIYPPSKVYSVTISDIVETGIFIDGRFSGGSLRVSVTLDKVVDTIDRTEISNVIDTLDHCTVSNCIDMCEGSDRHYYVDLNEESNIYKSDNDILEYSIIAGIIYTVTSEYLKDSISNITITSFDEKLSVSFSREDLLNLFSLIETLKVGDNYVD